MIIEFADPGIDWTFLNWFLAIIGLGILLFFIGAGISGFLDTKYGPSTSHGNWIAPGFVVAVVGFVFSVSTLIASPLAYSENRVPEATVSALEAAGFENVTLDGTRFTADDNGRFFSGVLIDLYPDSGYSYQVVDLTNPKD